MRPRRGGLAEHFGVFRWGFPDAGITDESYQGLVRSFEEWRQEAREAENQPDRGGRFVVDLTRSLQEMSNSPGEGPVTVAAAIATLGFLWAVRDFTSVERYGNSLLTGIRVTRRGATPEYERLLVSIGGGLENMTAAAAVRRLLEEGARIGPSTTPNLARSDRLVEYAEELAAENREFSAPDEAIAIAQGYILFHVWHAMNVNSIAQGRRGTPRRMELARRSVEVCVRALEGTSADSPFYALLINHCLYVIAVSSVDALSTTRVSELVREFIVLRTGSSFWSYRFDDTLGFHYFRLAYEAFTGTGSAVRPPTLCPCSGRD